MQRAVQTNMGLDVLKIILLCGIRDDSIDMLNLLGKGDISKESFEKIIELCKIYSRGLIRPQLPSQPNPNPNNKAVHQFETTNMISYSITPIPCNDIRL